MVECDEVLIGPYRFDADGAALHGPDGCLRLEERAARVLGLLCSTRGQVVTKAEILEKVWHGRTVSPNSVAVVIADLRRALGDDARQPRYVLTVPKRGYRLSLPAPADRPAPVPEASEVAGGRPVRIPPRAGLRAMVALLVLLVVAVGVGLAPSRGPHRPSLLIRPVRNDTGLAADDRTARALFELVRLQASHIPGLSVRTTQAGPLPAGSEIMSATLILWNGRPTLSLTAVDARSGAVRWAAMAEGPDEALAGHTVERLDDFAARQGRVTYR